MCQPKGFGVCLVDPSETTQATLIAIKSFSIHSKTFGEMQILLSMTIA